MTSWRDTLPVHPAAELFPLMGQDELRALGEDIKKNGLLNPVVFWSPEEKFARNWREIAGSFLLDGRNRLDALEAVGIDVIAADGKSLVSDLLITNVSEEEAQDPYAYVISANIHRRHLTTAQKSELIETLLKAKPERSDRATAKIAQISDKTVGKVRERLEATAEIPQLDKRVGDDGKARVTPAEKPKSGIERGLIPPSAEAIAKLNLSMPASNVLSLGITPASVPPPGSLVITEEAAKSAIDTDKLVRRNPPASEIVRKLPYSGEAVKGGFGADGLITKGYQRLPEGLQSAVIKEDWRTVAQIVIERIPVEELADFGEWLLEYINDLRSRSELR
jgi:hypothetical protein